MKKLIYPIALLLISCNTTKEANETQISPGFTKVNVSNKYVNEGCDFLMLLNEDTDKEEVLNPYNLSDEYKKDGISVLIKYNVTRMPQQNDCGLGTPIIIDSIVRI